MENKVQVQDHSQEILSVIRSNASPGILRNKLEDYHENDLADIFPELNIRQPEYTMIEFDDEVSDEMKGILDQISDIEDGFPFETVLKCEMFDGGKRKYNFT